VWQAGETIIRREVVNDGRCWARCTVRVVRDEPGLLATFLARGTEFDFPEPELRHPWQEDGKKRWRGHGVLMLQRPDEAHAIWVFWRGARRRFAGWYVNLQEPFRRTAEGYDTQDLELDIWVPARGGWQWKDAELLEQRVAEGRFTATQREEIWAEGRRVAAELDAGRRWWDDAWASWQPDPAWRAA
jgi:hypothetical protein